MDGVTACRSFQAFVEDLCLLTIEQAEFFAAGSLTLLDEDDDDEAPPASLVLSDFQAYEPGHGWGHVMLDLLEAMADRHGVPLFLQAATEFLSIPPALQLYETGGEAIDWRPPQVRLVAFYKRHGFEVISETDAVASMIRQPGAPDQAKQHALDQALAGEPVSWPGRAGSPAP